MITIITSKNTHERNTLLASFCQQANEIPIKNNGTEIGSPMPVLLTSGVAITPTNTSVENSTNEAFEVRYLEMILILNHRNR